MTLTSTRAQVLLMLLGSAVLVVLVFQRLRIPSGLAYLLIGLLLGPFIAGPVVDAPPLQVLAEFGVGAVFAQSLTTLISGQLDEQREEHRRHARPGVAMSAEAPG